MTVFFSYGEKAAAHPTSRTRVRVGWRGRLVLQVEIKHPRPWYPRCPPAPGTTYDPWKAGSYTFWRDATLADLAGIEPIAVKVPSAAAAGAPA